jgi:hypothetical protein
MWPAFWQVPQRLPVHCHSFRLFPYHGASQTDRLEMAVSVLYLLLSHSLPRREKRRMKLLESRAYCGRLILPHQHLHANHVYNTSKDRRAISSFSWPCTLYPLLTQQLWTVSRGGVGELPWWLAHWQSDFAQELFVKLLLLGLKGSGRGVSSRGCWSEFVLKRSKLNWV